jgi:hypothetical protein
MIFFNYKSQPTELYMSTEDVDDFKNSVCLSIHQEMGLSELTWIDASSYKKPKPALKCRNAEAIRTTLLSKSQMDLFH